MTHFIYSYPNIGLDFWDFHPHKGFYQLKPPYPLSQALNLLEATGGNLELAMNMFLDGGIAPSGDAPSAFQVPFDWYTLVWPEKEAIPESWAKQTIEFCKTDASSIGILQQRNGPCGILSALQAYVIIELLERAKLAGHPSFDINTTPSDDVLCEALCRTLRASIKHLPVGSPVIISNWTDPSKTTITSTEVEAKHAKDAVAAQLDAFTAEGGVVLLLYSCLLSRGVDQTKKDIAADVGEPPLILPPFHICTSELMGLLCNGRAGGNTSAYCVSTGAKQDWETDVGLLSAQEKEQGVPVADSLKAPPYPVWILHGGDHFTVLFSNVVAGVPEGGAPFPLYHWNGLAPAGPRMATLTITTPEGAVKGAPAKHKATFKKTPKGAIDDIVQATEADKKARPGQWKTWEYEVVLAVDDPDVKESEEDADAGEEVVVEEPEPLFNLGAVPTGPWRCASCYHSRFKTMVFGLNEDTPACQYCNKPREEALWSLRVKYEDMPKSVKNLANRMFAPKVCQQTSTERVLLRILPDLTRSGEAKSQIWLCFPDGEIWFPDLANIPRSGSFYPDG